MDFHLQQGQHLGQSQQQAQRLSPVQRLESELLPLNLQELTEQLETRLLQNPLIEVDFHRREESAGDVVGDALQRNVEQDDADRCSEEEYVPESLSPLGQIAERELAEALEKEERGGEEDSVPGDSVPGESSDMSTAEPEESFPDFVSEGSLMDREELQKRHQYALDSCVASESPWGLLEEQLGELVSREKDPALYRACRQVLQNLNTDGWLLASDEEIARDAAVSLPVAQRAVEVIQGMEPAGIGGRTLREICLLQLSRKNLQGTALWNLCRDHLEELGHHQYTAIARAMKLSPDEVETLQRQLQKTVFPRPCAELFEKEEPVFDPDGEILRGAEGKWEIRTNESHFPEVFLAPSYEELLRHPERWSKEEKAYFQKMQGEVQLLSQVLQSRKSLFLRVLAFILERQEPFFRLGKQALRPLRMQEAAAALETWESSISRVVQGKYVQTPWGVMRLRDFFSSGYQLSPPDAAGESGEGMDQASSQAVQERIRELVASEDKRHPLSDQKLVELLEKSGVPVARRTVAKYRGILGIPGTAERRWR